jgi:hypothetical protein
MTLTIIHDLYLMGKGPMPLRSQLVWLMPYENIDLCGGENDLHLHKWMLLVNYSLDTPYLQPEGLET